MSEKHPVIAVTGSSGAGTSSVKTAFEHIFLRLNVEPCIVEGDSFEGAAELGPRSVTVNGSRTSGPGGGAR